MNDLDLLNEYVNEGSEKAFEEIVRRHIPMVYSSARRRVGPENADDVTQAVFIILARKAARLCRGRAANLAGWLFRATRFAALEAIRGEKRRVEREQTADERWRMTTEETKDVEGWKDALPVLDQALDDLSGKDRSAVLMHYLEGADYAQVGQALGLSEDAVAKRMSRALEKLRRFLVGRGATLSVSGLMTMLTVHGTEAAPAGLAGSCAAAVLGGARGGEALAEASAIAKGAMKTMLLSQVKAVVAAGCIVLAAGTGAWVAADRATGDERDVCPDLQVRTIEPFPLEYVARSSLPDGSLEFQINSRADGRTHFVKMGEDVNGLRVAGHEEKTEERVIPGLKKPATVDVSGLTLQTGERRIVLRLNQAPSPGEHVAGLRSADGVEHRTMVGDVLQAGAEKYKVIGMDPQQGNATVRRESDGREMVVEKAKR